jgi:hypothetical protein
MSVADDTAILAEKFWPYVQRTAGCWLWTGGHSGTGYGMTAKVDGRQHYAHRISYEITFGPIPEGHDIHHRCGNRACVNPFHLEAMTHRAHLRLHRHKDVCDHGHPLTGDNLLVYRTGRRRCRACHNREERERNQRLKQAKS